MGDGGGCHPRDNIALSWLARELNLSHDIYNDLMKARENQTDWLADLILTHKSNLPVVILGKAFKPETNLTVGSPSVLLKNLLEEKGIDVDMYDPCIDEKREFREPSLFFIGTKHEVFKSWTFPSGSIILDPFRYIDGDNVIKIGVGK
jgi:UDPglucose 6-dehydrogenase